MFTEECLKNQGGIFKLLRRENISLAFIVPSLDHILNEDSVDFLAFSPSMPALAGSPPPPPAM